jgi:hypothetical protein
MLTVFQGYICIVFSYRLPIIFTIWILLFSEHMLECCEDDTKGLSKLMRVSVCNVESFRETLNKCTCIQTLLVQLAF